MRAEQRRARTRLEVGAGRAVRPAGLRLRRSLVLAALDDAGRLLRDRTRVVALGSLALLTPLLIIGTWAGYVAADRVDRNGAILPQFAGEGGFDGFEGRLYAAAAVLGSLSAAVVGAYCAAVLIGDRFGHPVSISWALRRTRRVAGTVVVAWLVTHWWQCLLALWVFAGTADSAIGRGFVALSVGWWASTVTLFVAPLAIAEQTPIRRVIGRAWELARSQFGAALGFVICSAAFGALFTMGLGALPLVVASFGVVPPGLAIAAQSLATVGVIGAAILSGLATAQLYLGVRLRTEALDIVLDAADAFGTDMGPR